LGYKAKITRHKHIRYGTGTLLDDMSLAEAPTGSL